MRFLFEGPVDDPAAFERILGAPGAAERLEAARDALADLEPFTSPAVEAALREVVERSGQKPGAVFQPIRVAIAGSTVSPGIFESLVALGREESLRRIDAALARARPHSGAGAA